MYKHAEKVESYFTSNSKWLQLYHFKVYQMSYQLLLIIVIGAIALGKKGSCSVPVQVFLSGLFIMYIFALVLNLLVFAVRAVRAYHPGSVQMKRLLLRVDLLYFPLYSGFSLVEFIWFIVGAEWISEDNNCMKEYPDGLRLSQALVVLWVLLMTAILVSFVSLNCYLCCRKYSGAQSLGPDVVISYPINDARAYPETPKIVDYTVSHTPARHQDD